MAKSRGNVKNRKQPKRALKRRAVIKVRAARIANELGPSPRGRKTRAKRAKRTVRSMKVAALKRRAKRSVRSTKVASVKRRVGRKVRRAVARRTKR